MRVKMEVRMKFSQLYLVISHQAIQYLKPLLANVLSSIDSLH